MTTCLVTGGSGFTGRHLIAHLKQQGHRVVALASRPAGADAHYQVPLEDPVLAKESLDRIMQTENPVRVFHLAALSFVGHPTPLDFYAVNVLGTQHLLEACCTLSTPPRVLIASSANVYGANASGQVSEQIAPAPVNHYAASKLAMEHIASTYAGVLPLLLVRPFNYTGPGQAEHFLVPKIVAHFQRRMEEIELGNLDVSRDFSDVRDIVAAYAEILADWPGSRQSGQVVNLGSGQATPLREILTTIEALTQHRMQVSVNPAFVRSNEIALLCADTTRLQTWSGYRPRYSLKATLRDMLEAPAV